MAISPDNFRLDQEGEVVGNPQGIFDFEASAGLRHVANDAIDTTHEPKDDRATFERAQPWAGPAFEHKQNQRFRVGLSSTRVNPSHLEFRE